MSLSSDISLDLASNLTYVSICTQHKYCVKYYIPCECAVNTARLTPQLAVTHFMYAMILFMVI